MNLKLLLQPPLISGKCGSIHGWIHGQCLSWSLHSCSICLSPWWWPMNEWWWLMTEWWIQCSISCPSNPHCLSQCSHGFPPLMLLANLVLKWRKAQSIGPGVVLYVHLDYNLHCIINNSFFFTGLWHIYYAWSFWRPVDQLHVQWNRCWWKGTSYCQHFMETSL